MHAKSNQGDRDKENLASTAAAGLEALVPTTIILKNKTISAN